MSGQAEQLQQLMSFFNIDESGDGPAPVMKQATTKKAADAPSKKPSAKRSDKPAPVSAEPEFVRF